ncbi:MAG: hypothetical protein EXS37_14255 [Opitutus sp.]|nr:hypothetical protein [Opitutus sp.]
MLAALGVAIWCGSAWVRPQTLGLVAVSTTWIALGLVARRNGFAVPAGDALHRMLTVSALVAVAVVAKSSCSVGPQGELFRGTVSRNFEMADRIDSRYSFYVVQAAALHLGPASPQTEKFFQPWTFFSRGPLAGLATTPIVLATGGQPPATFPDDRWRPFDRTGFAAYRVAMIALASSVIVALFMMMLPLVGERWATIAAGLLALSPFGVHEMMFTWPKWAATAWVVASFGLAHARRPLAAGLALAVGFMFHPLALLWGPWLALWSAGRSERNAGAITIALARFGVGAAVLVVPWMALGALMPHLPTTPLAGQGGFFRYFARADWKIPTWETWWQTRWMNFANTFLPLHVYFSDASFHHPKLSSAYEISGKLVRFSQVWWNTLPFGLGLGLWAISVAAVTRSVRALPAATWLFLFAPVLLITAYWGMDPLGLMRECGHPLFVALIAILCVIASHQRGWLHAALAHRAVPWLQLPETWLMLWLTTLLNPQRWTAEFTQLDPLGLAINAFALLAAARTVANARSAPDDADVAVVAPDPAPDPRPAQRNRARIPAAGWAIFGLGVLALVVAPHRVALEETRALPAIDASDAITGNGAFTANGVFASDKHEELPSGIAIRGSWLGSDAFQGKHETGWFRAAPRLSIMVAGYPMLPGNRLGLEVRLADGSVRQLPFEVHNIGEAWHRWTVALPAAAAAVRILATDTTTGPGGWLGFSAPFSSRLLIGGQLWGVLQLATTTCLALTLLLGPGLLWFGGRPRALPALAFAILFGPLLLAGLGLFCWIMGGALPPAALARAGIALLLGWMGWQAWQRRAGGDLPREVRIVIAAGALLSGFAVAKANLSFGPGGELFRDRVSRTLAVGNHSDSQISFHVVQIVAHHLGPYHDQTKIYFAPWRFASRGPLAGLMAAPLVLASGATVPFDHPTHPWRPFDRQGFAVYRIACIVLASLAGWVVFAAGATLASAAWGLVAAMTAMLAPFFVHEMYFSWPKLIAGALVLVAFLAARRGQPWVAGVMVALGYLFHPLAALSAPFLGLWLLAQPREGPWWIRLTGPAWFAAGALVLVVPWQIVGRLQPDAGADQSVFVQYFFFADSAHATWPTWWQSRWDNFANTFLPGYLLTADRAHPSLNSLYGPSDRWVQASFLYWNTLPFALGVPGFLLVAAAITQACRRAFALTWVTLFGPALFLIVYWGAASTGLMRQCGHTLFLSVIVVASWSLATGPSTPLRQALTVFLHPMCFAWRGIEIGVMAFGTTLLNRRPDLADSFGWNDVISLGAAVGCLTAVVILLAKTAGSIRSTLFPTSTISHS